MTTCSPRKYCKDHPDQFEYSDGIRTVIPIDPDTLRVLAKTTLEANCALEALAVRMRSDPVLAESFARTELVNCGQRLSSSQRAGPS